MKRGLSLALAGLGMCLLLVLGRLEAARGADNHPCLRSWARYAGPAGHPALPSPPAAWAAQATSRQAHAAPSESRAVHEVLLTESDPGPPWLVSRGPPGKVRGIVVDSELVARSVAQGRQCASSPRGKPSGGDRFLPKKGFATAFS